MKFIFTAKISKLRLRSYINVCIHAYIRIDKCTHQHTHTSTLVSMHSCTYIHAKIHAYIHICMLVCIYVCYMPMLMQAIELGGAQILETVQYFIKYHGINNYYGISINTFIHPVKYSNYCLM